ncbi:hypothetical protein PBY51_021786 [Eleginops maclovinus]|nr:hypothetical protein PBY51_021786 [Eleginops maclovinus]
MGISIVT